MLMFDKELGVNNNTKCHIQIFRLVICVLRFQLEELYGESNFLYTLPIKYLLKYHARYDSQPIVEITT